MKIVNLSKKSLRLAFYILSIGFVSFVLMSEARAANFTVNSSGDTSDAAAGNGVCGDAGNVCTLRAAVEEANALSSNDTINFAGSLTGATITLTTGVQILISGTNGTLQINGPGADKLTIDGGTGSNRIFFTDNAAAAIIAGVTMQNGGSLPQGGAIYANGGSLVLSAVHLLNNMVSDRGGAVYYSGGTNHRILNSAISGNSAFIGGGLYLDSAMLFVANTTISGNSVANSGSAAGGVYIGGGAATFRNSTITNNTASGSGSAAGGVQASGTFNFGNTIIAGNSAPNFPEIFNFGGATSAGNNFVGDSAGDSTNTNTAISYQTSDVRDQNPQLGTLQNNGGPTPTRALLAGSLAIDAGDNAKAVDPFDNSGLTSDQRTVYSRIGGSAVDIGAYEISSMFGPVTPPSGIIAWYAGDGDFRDSSGSGNNATPANGLSAPTFSIGEVGQTFTLNGGLFNSLQFASIPDSASIRPQSLTVEGWGKLTSVDSAAPTFFGKALGSGNSDSYVVWYQSGTLHGAICNNGGCAQLNAPSFSLNVWHHIALTFNDPGGAATKTLTLYVDGAAVASSTTTGIIEYDTHAALIGGDYDFESIRFGWTGEIDEITLYNRSLSAGEVQSINNAGINGKIKQAAANTGANSQSVVGDATISFENVTAAGTTTYYTIDPAIAGTLPGGYTQTGLAYQISTTAAFSGVTAECFHIASINDSTVFGKLKILHLEGGILIDRTTLTDFAARQVCGRTTTLSPFVIANGLSPTAAGSTLSGRAQTAKGGGIANVRITLTDYAGQKRTVVTNSFGYYRFTDVDAGRVYVVEAAAKNYNFGQTAQVVSVTSDLTELNFTALNR